MVEPDVEADADQHDGEDQQRALPSRSCIVGVLDDDQRLNQRTAEETSRSIACLPTKG